MNSINGNSPTLLGHPTGLFTLFFAEMWERFSYYGMRALLLFYMLKGFLGYGDSEAYAVYGSYTALVYMTPFFGGMIADRLLGARRAVVLGGLLMAAGHLMMTIEHQTTFFTALALLIAGNGFFKPNISTMVGTLYPQGSPKRDGGFTIFYMGINLGAAMSPLVCGYIGETYGWHYGFGLATIGMITGVAVFVAPSVFTQIIFAAIAIITALNVFVAPQYLSDPVTRNVVNAAVLGCLLVAGIIALVSLGRGDKRESATSTLLARLIIMAGAVAAAYLLIREHPDDLYSTALNYFAAVALLVAGVIAWVALGRGGLPAHTGLPPDSQRLRQPVLGIPAEWLVYVGALLAVPVLALLVSNFAPLTADGQAVTIVGSATIEKVEKQGTAGEVAAVVLSEISKPAGLILFVSGIIALVYLGLATFRLEQIPRERMFVVFILVFFNMLFWAFFEQAGSSVNNFTDRNVDRVFEARVIQQSDVGSTLRFRLAPETNDADLRALPLLGQEQFGRTFGNEELNSHIAAAIRNEETRKAKLAPEKIEDMVRAVAGDNVFTLSDQTYLRAAIKNDPANTPTSVEWTVTEDNIGMGVGGSESPASVYQALNPIYILLFGIVFTALWGFLGKRGLEPSTPVKFSLGLLQLGLGFGAFWYGAQAADDRGMVALSWLFLGYLLHTTGELCLSPVGLSMITKLSPAFLVSTVMGLWFLATAFSQFLAAIIAQFTGVGHGGEENVIPAPTHTVDLYGSVFGKIALAAIISSIICFALAPLLKKWMHEGEHGERQRPMENVPPQRSKP